MTIPLTSLLKNKVLMYKHYNLQDSTIDNWAFWMFEEIVKIINDISEEEGKQEKKQQDEQSSGMGGFNPSSYMNSMSGMANKFK
jgi:hypothetical protein